MPQLLNQSNQIFQGQPTTAQPSFSQFGGPSIGGGTPGLIGIGPLPGTGGPIQDPTGSMSPRGPLAPKPFPLPGSPFSPGETDVFNRLNQPNQPTGILGGGSF